MTLFASRGQLTLFARKAMQKINVEVDRSFDRILIQISSTSKGVSMKNLRTLLIGTILFYCLNIQLFATTLLQQSVPQSSPLSIDPDELMKTGASLYRQQKYEEASTYFEKAVKLKPNDFRPLTLLGIAYQAQLKLKSASEAFGKATLLQPADKKIYLMKAVVDSRRNATEEALAACHKALELDPTYAEAFTIIGKTLRWDEKRRSEAISAYQSAIKINPNLLDSYEALGGILENVKDEKGAEEIYRKGMALDPEKMSGRFVLGRMLVKQGRLKEARELWNDKTSADDFMHPTFIEVLTRAENLQRAKDDLAKAPNSPEALVNLGLAIMDGDSWVMDRRQEKAREYFNQALKLKPDYAKAHYGICKGYIQLEALNLVNKKLADDELTKLKMLDKSLVEELIQYRKNTPGGLPGGFPVDFNK
jgi:tetratricopeptide (TPR) repeat protein